MVPLLFAPLLMAAVQDPMTVPLVALRPKVDCVINDAAWSAAAPLDGFLQTHPAQDAPPTYQTRVRLAYTEDALHVGIEADDDPSLVRSTLAARDGIGAEDHVAFYFDTFHDRRRSYVVMVNALGVQQDGLLAEGREPDYSADFVFSSSGCRTKTGYAIEMSIPFASLRYEVGPGRVWGLHVMRHIQRLGEENSWMPLKRDRTSVDGTSGRQVRSRFLAQAGTITGLDQARHVPLLEAIPVLGATDGSGTSGRIALGGTARLSLSPASTVDIAVNPDFAEVEADAPQSTANLRFPLFYPEKRPFFLEGADLLTTPIRAFHSRTILDPDLALKSTLTRGRTQAAALIALDPGPGRYTTAERSDPTRALEVAALDGRRALSAVVRARRAVGLDSTVGVLATTRSFGEGRNQVFGLDARVALGRRTLWNAQALSTLTRRSPSAPASANRDEATSAGFGYATDLSRTGSRLSVQLTGEGYSPDYRADLGYTQRSDTHRWSQITRFNFGRSRGPLVSWSAINTTLVQFDWKARAQYGYVYPRLLFAFKRQTVLNLSAYRDYIRVFEDEFGASRAAGGPGAFLGAPSRSSWYHGFTVDAGSSPTRSVTFGALFDRSWNNLDFDQGAGRFPRVSPAALTDPKAPLDPGPANSRYFSLSLTLRPRQSAQVSMVYDNSRLVRQDTGRDVYRQHLASARVQWSFSRFLWLRTRLDYDSLDDGLFQQLVLAWTPKPGRALYTGYDETGEWLRPSIEGMPRTYARRDRTLFFKLSWSGTIPLRRRRASSVTISPVALKLGTSRGG